MDPIDAAVTAAESRLDAGDPLGAARCIEQFEQARGRHERLARVWSRLLPAVGNPKILERQIRALAAEWPRHPIIAMSLAEAGTRWRDPWPFEAGPDRTAALAVDVIDRCIADGRLDPRWVAPLHLARGRALARVGPAAEDEALGAFEVALSAAPDDAVGWADLARLHQIRRRWAKGLAAARQALEHAPDLRPARWTAATCATAIGDAEAADLWRALDHLPAGFDDGGRPRVEGLPAVEVVIGPGLPGGGPEVVEAVWVHPTSPVHGRVASPTVLDLPADFDDVLLWDPVPRGFRPVGDAEVPCFTALAVLGAGGAETWRVAGEARGASWPEGWRLYPFDGRVRGPAPAVGSGKLITPRGARRTAVQAAVERAGLRLI